SKTDLLEFKIDHPYVSILVNEAQALKQYMKGDSLQKLCAPITGTIGKYYLDHFRKIFQNPVIFTNDNDHLKLYHYFFDFIDNVETLFKELLDHELSELNIDTVKTLYAKVVETINLNHRAINEFSFPFFTDKSVARVLTPSEQGLLNIFI